MKIRVLLLASVFLFFVSCMAEKQGARPSWVDNPLKGSMEEKVIYGTGIAEGFSEGDLRRAAAAQARQDISDTLLVNIKGRVEQNAKELTNYKDMNESESQNFIKTVSEQSSSMSLPMVVVENYYTDKKENGRIAVYARAKIDLTKVQINEMVKVNFKNNLEVLSKEGKLTY